MLCGLRGAGPPMGEPGEGAMPCGGVGASGWSWWARRAASGGGVGVVVLMGFSWRRAGRRQGAKKYGGGPGGVDLREQAPPALATDL